MYGELVTLAAAPVKPTAERAGKSTCATPEPPVSAAVSDTVTEPAPAGL